MADEIVRKKPNWAGLIGGIVTGVSLVGGVIGIRQYFAQNPRVNINGTWVIALKIEKTSYAPYQNLDLTYTAQLIQDGNTFTGSGEKSTEAGHEVEGKAHTPIKIKGTLTSSSIDAEYTESGTERESHGEFHWKLQGGQWSGTFLSTAADESGTATLKQVSQ